MFGKTDNPFWLWLQEHYAAVASMLAAFGVSSTYGVARYLWGVLETPPGALAHYPDAVPPGTTALIVAALVIVGLIGLRQARSQRADARARAAVRQFHNVWMAQWLVWFALYALLTFLEFNVVERARAGLPPMSPYWSLLVDVLSNGQTMLFIVSYAVLSRKTLEDDLTTSLFWVIPLLVFGLVCTVEAVAFTVADKKEFVAVAAKVVSGVAAAIGMAVFIGRLESRYFNFPGLVIALMYLYAALQVFYGLFGLAGDLVPGLSVMQPLIITLALPLKVLLFLMVYWTVTSGRLLFYFERYAETAEGVEKAWADFQNTLEYDPGTGAPQPAGTTSTAKDV